MKNNFCFLFFMAFLSSFFSQELSFSQKNPLKVGLALSGGGAKGYAHIGVLKVLEKAGIKIDYISGTSIGAIVGALYAAGYSASELEEIVKKTDFSEILFKLGAREITSFFDKKHANRYAFQLPLKKFQPKLPNSISNSQNIYDFFSNLLYRVKHIEEFSKLPISFLCITTDLQSGNAVILKEGDLVKSILASSSLPTLMKPIKINDRIYIDGGVVSNLPVNELKAQGVNYVIASDISSDENLKIKKDSVALTTIISQLILYKWRDLKKDQTKNANILIRPDIKDFSILSFDQKESLIQKGEKEALKYLHKLKKIAKIQNDFSQKEKFSNFLPDKISLEDIRVEGLDVKETEYFLDKLNLDLKNITSKNLETAINKIKESQDFSHLFYHIHPMEPSKYSLFMEATRSPYENFLKLGIHHDYVFKTSILFNYTLKKIFFLKDFLSIDFIFGENYRGNLNYYIDKGWNGFGYQVNFMQYNSFNSKFIKENEITKRLFIKNYDFMHRIYWQLHFSNQFTCDIGIENNFFYRKGEIFIPAKYRWKASTIGAYNHINVDYLDYSNFPRKGFLVNIENQLYVLTKEEDLLDIIQLQGDFQINFPFNKLFSLRLKSSYGISKCKDDANNFFDKFFDSYNFLPRIQYFLGGINKQKIFNSQAFYGYPFFRIYGWNKILFGAELQLKIVKNHYFTFAGNVANLENEFSDLSFHKFKYKGLLFSYGYDSIIGPLEFFFNYSPDKNGGEKTWYISLGFMF